MKKIFSVMLIVTLIFTCMPTCITSAEQVTEQDVYNLFYEEVAENNTNVEEEISNLNPEVQTTDSIEVLNELDEDAYVDNQVLVMLTLEESRKQNDYSTEDFPTVDLTDVSKILNYYSDSDNHVILTLTLTNSGKDAITDAISTLQQDERVHLVTLNEKLTPYADENDTLEEQDMSISESTITPLSTPGYTDIQEDTEGNAGQYIYACCARKYIDPSYKVKVGIADSGIDPAFTELEDKIVARIDCTQEGSTDTSASSFHGGQVASVIAREQISTMNKVHDVCGNNSCWGVCPSVDLYSFKISKNNGDTAVSFFTRAINQAREYGVQVLNFSSLFPSKSTSTDLNQCLVQAVNSYNGIIITSAGNISNKLYYTDATAPTTTNTANIDNAVNIVYPNSIPSDKIIVVGECYYSNSDKECRRAPSSCFGQNTVDLFATGTTYALQPDGTYLYTNGTSYAAPRVAGAAAVLLNICPTLSISQLRHYLLGGVSSSNNLADKCVTGGNLNIYKSAKMLISDLAYQGETVFAGHFTNNKNLAENQYNNMQVAAYCKTGANQVKAYVWTYDANTEKFSDPVHWFTQNSFNLDNNKQRSVSGDFDNNGYDEICTFKDNSAVFVCGNGYSKNTYTSSLSASGFTGRMVALDYDNDGKDEMAGIYDTGTWGHAKIYVWDFVSSGSGMSSNQTCVYDSGAGNYEADYVTGRVVAGDFDDSDDNEEIAALYYFPTSGNYSLHRFDINGTTTTLTNLRYKQSDIDVSKVTGRVVACDYNAGTLDEVVCMYDNSANVSAGVINYGFYFTAHTNSWTTTNLYTSSEGAHYASFSTNRMVAADFTGDALDDIVSFYKFDSATDSNDRGIICMSIAPELYGYFKKWDPKE